MDAIDVVMKKDKGLNWPELTPGTLIRRYKRFLAEVRLENGKMVTAHCANSGRMDTCSEPGRRVFLSYHDNPKRKLKYTWELIEMPTSLVGVNTQVPNRLVAQSIKTEEIQELGGYDKVISEFRTGSHSRIDLLLIRNENERCFVEIKNCTLIKDATALFPDAVTARGLKHIVELERLMQEGNRCVMFFLVQRMDAKSFAPADAIDPAYGERLRVAAANGLEILAYDVIIDLQGIRMNRKLPLRL
jgi:sugar fermentation stimulation protein A